MDAVSQKLSRLRNLFLAYFLVTFAIDCLVAWKILRSMFASGFGHRFAGVRFTSGSILAFSLITTGIVLVLALVVFDQLRQRKNWARVLLLVLGWLSVIGAVASLLVNANTSTLGGWLGRLVPEIDWGPLLRIGRITDVLKLFFWGCLIYVLQIDAQVSKEFLPPAGPNDSSRS